jgi:hypothetical protein
VVHRGGGEPAERRPAIADLRPAVRELQIVELAVQRAVERLLRRSLTAADHREQFVVEVTQLIAVADEPVGERRSTVGDRDVAPDGPPDSTRMSIAVMPALRRPPGTGGLDVTANLVGRPV